MKLTVINPINDTVTRTIAPPRLPEFMAVDNAGIVFVNIAATASSLVCNRCGRPGESR
jgi:hypothetical protein